MPVFFQLAFALAAISGIVLGFLMMIAPTRYPKLYVGFLSESMMRRETTERGRILAIRVSGLISLSTGAFFVLFVWALR
jgi:hypothetical protein